MEWIDEIVTGLLDLYGTRDVYEICDVLKINIEKHPADHRLLRGNKGNYMRCISDIEMIVLREDLDEACEEFVLAHELGHALLHTNLNSFVFRGFTNKSKYEKQANYFAMKLLDFEGKLDSIALEGFTIEQIASTLNLQMEGLEIIKEMKESYTA